MKDFLGGRRILLELLEVAFFNLFHEGLAVEEELPKLGGELARHDKKLIVNHFRKRDRTTRGNEMRTPLEHEASVPKNEDGKAKQGSGQGHFRGTGNLCEAVEEGAKTKNEERSQRNKKPIAVGRDACLIGVA